MWILTEENSMIEIIIGVLIIILLVLIGLQGQQITRQQAQTELLRDTLTEYMTNMTQFVQAQDAANTYTEEVLRLTDEYIKNSNMTLLALAHHCEYLEEQIKAVCNFDGYETSSKFPPESLS
jgi:type II secretory pathway pseudopilin PulG